jgi:hypothetical protein
MCRAVGATLSNDCQDVAGQLGAGRADVQLSTGNPPRDLYDQHNRVVQYDVTQDQQESGALPQRSGFCQSRSPSGVILASDETSQGVPRWTKRSRARSGRR